MAEYRRIQIGPDLSLFTKPKSKWMKHINIKPDALNLIVEKARNSPELIGMGKNF